ncbi:segregation/condensation protein A [Streptomyces sp. Pv4-95]|uniref:segregation and condensation protein A n=1 Tax=Streptomyces sp. Pv4-95 TaxID=3049543 RepID=UPI0038918260
MPTTHDDAPPPRPRRTLGRGPAAGPVTEEPAPPAEEPAAAPERAAVPDPATAPEPVTVPEAATAPEPAILPGPAAEQASAPEPLVAPEGREPAAAHDGEPDPSAAVDVADPVDPADPAEADTEIAADADVEAPAQTDGGIETEADPADAGDGRFTVRLDNFEGPFDLLLQLISKHKMDVTEVALSKVTDEFMAHIRAMGPDWDLDQTTEFLVVAATLLDLKAARLLPAAEVEDEADLALLEARDLLFARLLQYRAYKRIADIFSDRLADESRRHPRTVGLEPHLAELLPEVVISIGAEGFAKLAVKAMQPKARPQVYVDHIHAPLVSVREQAEVMVARLREAGESSFQELIADAPDTLTVVARFLALLELYRERVVVLDQEEALGALTVRWTGSEGSRPVVTDEFDQEPAERAAVAAARPAETPEPDAVREPDERDRPDGAVGPEEPEEPEEEERA